MNSSLDQQLSPDSGILSQRRLDFERNMQEIKKRQRENGLAIAYVTGYIQRVLGLPYNPPYLKGGE